MEKKCVYFCSELVWTMRRQCLKKWGENHWRGAGQGNRNPVKKGGNNKIPITTPLSQTDSRRSMANKQYKKRCCGGSKRMGANTVPELEQ